MSTMTLKRFTVLSAIGAAMGLAVALIARPNPARYPQYPVLDWRAVYQTVPKDTFWLAEYDTTLCYVDADSLFHRIRPLIVRPHRNHPEAP